MSNCLNCKIKLSCSCKKRKAINGTSCCTVCVRRYDAQYSAQQKTLNADGARKQPAAPVMLSATAVQKLK